MLNINYLMSYPFNPSPLGPYSSVPPSYTPYPNHHQNNPGNNNYNTFTGTMYDSPAVPHTDTFKIVMILDESGSMENIRSKMISSINTLITEQQQIPGRETTFTLVKFSDGIKRVIENKPLNQVKLLTPEHYMPNGSTALFDAIGDTISWFRNEKDVLMVIVTDGQENASHRFNRTMINNMIEDKQKNNNWTYVYLSNDLSTAKQGDSIGCTTSRVASNCVVEQESFGDYISSQLNSAIGNYRCKGVSVQSQLNK